MDKTRKPKRQKGKILFYYFWLFIFGSIVGFWLEGVWCILTKGHWENHSALVYAPLCVIYGFGALVMYGLSGQCEKKPLILQGIIFIGAGTVLEYSLSVLQEAVFGSVSWNYSKRFLNFQGRVCLFMSMLWGMLGIIFVKWIFPFLKKLICRMYCTSLKVVTAVLLVLLLLDTGISVLAVNRWRERNYGIENHSMVAEWLDTNYDNGRMEKIYPTMRFP